VDIGRRLWRLANAYSNAYTGMRSGLEQFDCL
jgi:hypothetical protein